MTVTQPSRRSVLRGVALAATAGVAGFVVARNSDAHSSKPATAAANATGYGASSDAAAATVLAGVDAVPAGGGLIIEGAGVVLTRSVAGEIRCFSAVCTHQGCRVTSVEGDRISCPCHGSQFDASTGAPTAGPASRPLPQVPVRVVGDDIVAG